MTISSTESRKSYSGSGSTGPFALPGALVGRAGTEIGATRADTSGVETALTLNAGSDGFTVDSGVTEITLTEALASGETLVIIPSMDFKQSTDYSPNDAFPAETHEAALDKIVLQQQQLKEQLDRVTTLVVTSSLSSVDFPAPGAGEYIRWNAGGTALETAPSSVLADINDITNVTITSASTNEILTWNGSAWVNQENVVVTGAADQVQLQVTGHSTQTNNVFLVENSASSALLSVDNSGNVAVAGTVDGRDLATDGTKLDGIEASADVTDATNVAAAGAIMDSDVSGNGLIARTGAGAYSERTITGTSNEVSVSDGDGQAANPTIGIADNAVLPGTEAVRLPSGTTAQRNGTPTNGDVRYNSTENKFEGYENGAWANLISAGGGGDSGRTLIESQTASTSATLDFTTSIDGTYDFYEFEIVDIWGDTTGGVALHLRTSTDGGSSWDASSGAYQYTRRCETGGGVFVENGGGTTATEVRTTQSADFADTTDIGLFGTVTMFGHADATADTGFHGRITYMDNTGTYHEICDFSGTRESAADVDGVRFLMSSGNIQSGTIRLWGISKS
jgi:hypothetical protein